MRSLNSAELRAVAGGDEESTSERVAELCDIHHLPDSVEVSYTISSSGTIGIGDTGVSNTSGATIETTCGEARESAGNGG